MLRNKYTNQFKAKIVLEIIRGDREFNEVFPIVFSADSTAEQKKAQKKGENLKRSYDRLLKDFGQVTLERNFLQDCFRKAGEPIPKLPGDDSDEF